MPSPRLSLPPTSYDWDALRAELHLPTSFPADVEAEAAQSAREPDKPERDLTDVPFLTIDPAGAVDLDQAMALSRTATGYLVRYAIADVAAFVRPGGLVDAEAHRRGVTLYSPDRRTPLHPTVLSEDAASLLPDQDRPALVWELSLDADGALTRTHVERAVVRSRRQLDYESVQRALADGTATEDLALLETVGRLRQQQARARRAVELPTPEQVVDADGRLTYRAPLPAEQWNAEISLLTGMAAAALMLEGSVGLLRTLPRPPQEAVDSLRRSALALGVAWPEGAAHGDVLSALDPAVPHNAALLTLATRLLRGAGYTAFDGSPPDLTTHSAVAAPYAHCTAPLRRLADRYVGEVCLSLCAGVDVPGWAREALPVLPGEMAQADRRAHELDRAAVDLAEAWVLQHRVGESFEAVVVDTNGTGGTVQLTEPAVRGRVEGAEPPLGRRVEVVLAVADVRTRKVAFRLG
ncbi:MAG TPA: RNB domain-containing ribonuclease [Mycobacteriales bacterium]|nr:RNB domain-containing ribonuclease [Mycobacteriales bacterium]